MCPYLTYVPMCLKIQIVISNLVISPYIRISYQNNTSMAFNLQTFKTRALTAVVFVLVMLAGLLWNQWSFWYCSL
jgi:hypothetical protein